MPRNDDNEGQAQRVQLQLCNGLYVDVEKDVSAAAVRVYLLIVQPSHVARFIYSRDFPSSCMTIPVYQVLKPFSTIQCSRYSYNSPNQPLDNAPPPSTISCRCRLVTFLLQHFQWNTTNLMHT